MEDVGLEEADSQGRRLINGEEIKCDYYIKSGCPRCGFRTVRQTELYKGKKIRQNCLTCGWKKTTERSEERL